MKSYHEWQLTNSNPEWERIKNEWGGGKNIDKNLVNKMKLKIEGIKEWYVRELNDKNIKTWRDIPPHMRDALAQSIVTATIQAFYSEAITPSGNIQNTKPIPAPPPQKELDAPSGWKG